MFLEQPCVRWLVSLALAVTTLLMSGDAANADTWSRSNGCDCGGELPAAGWAAPRACAATTLPGTATTRPFWQRPTPAYNSSWKQVPVTNYQTQVINDPLSGVAVTTIQPCNTYESQLRRTAGCSLWQRFVRWWRSRCCCIGRPLMPPATAACPPTSEWGISSAEPTASPYYAPATNGRLVPVPSSISPPSSSVPADLRPQLGPVPQRPVGAGSASRLLPAEQEVFVRTLDGPVRSVELGPPLVAPRSGDAEEEVAHDLERARPISAVELGGPIAAAGERFGELVPVSWSIPTPAYERKLPTDEVWDDTGWRSEQ